MSISFLQILQMVCSLSLLVFLHEGGHFLFAKFSGVKVEKFYLFFNPYFHLFSTRDKWFTKLFPYFKDNETEYGIGWLPLGGYVSIAGMVDETKDAEDVAARQPEATDFNQKSVWRRFLIMFGGVLFNLITALVVYSAIMFTWGREITPMRNLPYGLNFNAMAQQIGFRNGDTPIRVDGVEIEGFSEGALMMDISEAKMVTVLRDGGEVDIEMPAEGVSLLEMQKAPLFFSLPLKPIVAQLVEDMPASKAGMKVGDKILAINGRTTLDVADVNVEMGRCMDILSASGCTHEDSLRALTLSVVRLSHDSQSPDTLSLALSPDVKMGLLWDNSEYQKIPTEKRSYTFLQSIPAGCAFAWETITDYVVSLKYLFNKDGVKQVGSFLTIGSLFPETWDWQIFWNMTAFLSIILAVMNILPIPGLDGGHIVLLIYEGIFRRPPSLRVMGIIQNIGMFILFGLMLLAIGNDVLRFFF
jgi:regulator of sigma E protease